MATPLFQHYRHPLDARFSEADKNVIVLILDHAGRFIRWNRAAENLTGYAAAEMVGHFFWEGLLFAADREPVCRQFKWIMSGWPPGSLEYRWKLRDGTVRWMVCSDFERCTSPSGAECLAFAATDVTESRLSRDWRASLFAEFIRAREIERSEISRFVHDTVAQNLVALTFSLEQQALNPAVQNAELALELVERCCRDIRFLGYMLAPPVLGEGGLLETLENHARALREAGALDMHLLAELPLEVFSPEASAVLFSAVQEFTVKAITNRATKSLAIVLRRDDLSAVMEMKGAFGPDGAGDRDCPAIREAVRALGGRVEISPSCLRIAFPAAFAATASQ
jgi:PAS domain S-box-containing protein